MGNRAVITTKENWAHGGVGVYLHWNGGRDSVEAFLKYCDLKGYRSPSDDCYGWARLCQVCGNFFGGTTSIGIDTLWHIDCNNYDNGVYIIEGWEIVDRCYFEGQEQDSYSLNEMLIAIDEAMPEEERIGDFLKAKVTDEVQIGDKIVRIDWNGQIEKAEVEGFGGNDIVNGHDVNGVPYVNLYGEDHAHNINNYLIKNNWRKVVE